MTGRLPSHIQEANRGIDCLFVMRNFSDSLHLHSAQLLLGSSGGANVSSSWLTLDVMIVHRSSSHRGRRVLGRYRVYWTELRLRILHAGWERLGGEEIMAGVRMDDIK